MCVVRNAFRFLLRALLFSCVPRRCSALASFAVRICAINEEVVLIFVDDEYVRTCITCPKGSVRRDVYIYSDLFFVCVIHKCVF